jgi:hypothetical protein
MLPESNTGPWRVKRVIQHSHSSAEKSFISMSRSLGIRRRKRLHAKMLQRALIPRETNIQVPHETRHVPLMAPTCSKHVMKIKRPAGNVVSAAQVPDDGNSSSIKRRTPLASYMPHG